jgi:hypothetical protein
VLKRRVGAVLMMRVEEGTVFSCPLLSEVEDES